MTIVSGNAKIIGSRRIEYVVFLDRVNSKASRFCSTANKELDTACIMLRSTRGATSKVYDYFGRADDTQEYKCKVQVKQGERDEGKAYETRIKYSEVYNVCSNLKRHIERCHAAEWRSVQEFDSAPAKKLGSATTLPKQLSASAFFVPLKLKVEIDKDQFISGIVKMAVGGTPLAAFSKSGFTPIGGEMAKKLGVSLDSGSIRRYIIEVGRLNEQQVRLLSHCLGK